MRIIYFGCLKQAGHHAWLEDCPKLWLTRQDPLRPVIITTDGLLPPQIGRRVQGQVAVHYIHGYTVLAWWDYSIDKRPGSNSAFWVEGKHTPKEALRLGLEYFKTVAARIDYSLTLPQVEEDR